MALCNPCVRPADTSVIVTCFPRPPSSLKVLLRRRLFKKATTSTNTRANHKQSTTSARFQRVKGSNIVREVNPIINETIRTDSTLNYDMTAVHNDILDDTDIIMARRQNKRIPRWARKSQLQLAFINQIYFEEQRPEDIFGSVRVDLAQEMVQSIDCGLKKPFEYPSYLPANFV